MAYDDPDNAAGLDYSQYLSMAEEHMLKFSDPSDLEDFSIEELMNNYSAETSSSENE